MLELSRQLWQIFAPSFAVLAVGGCAPLYYLDGKSYQLLISIILWSLSFVFLIVAAIALAYDIKDTLKKHKAARAPSVYEKRGPLIF